MAITSATCVDSGNRRLFRRHQANAIQAATDHYRHNDRGQLILPCGVGKTATASGIREALAAETTLVLLPSLVLVKQFRDEWAAWRSTPYADMCVCSDADKACDEDAPSLDALGLRGASSTDPAAVARFLSRPGAKVVFSTYHSMDAVCLAARKSAICFDLAVCDEAHRTAGCGMRLFGRIHHDANLWARKRLYMTATPRVAASSARSPSGEAVSYDMDDPGVFGRPFFQMTFRQAIDSKLLADYSVVAIGISDKEVRQWMSESASCGELGTATELAMNYALNLAMRKHGARRAISYHSRVQTAEDFADRHRRLFGDVFSAHVSGRQSADARKENLAQFATAPLATVTNVRCLVEGFDLPAVDMVFFCDPKRSTIDVIQSMGRALRIDSSRPGKRGLIVLPVFHASVGDLDDGLAHGDYRHVVDVLTALSETDEVLKGEISDRSSVNTAKSTQPEAKTSTESVAQPPATRDEAAKVVVTGFDARLAKSLFDQVVGGLDGISDPWQVSYRALLRFREANPSRWPAPGEASPEGLDLWKWLRAQRRANRRGTLSDARRRLLDACGLLVEARPCWLVQFQCLRSRVAMHPGTWPAKEKGSLDGNRLGAWCAAQRRARTKGVLSKERVQLLDGLGFPWGRFRLGDSAVTSSREQSHGEVTVCG